MRSGTATGQAAPASGTPGVGSVPSVTDGPVLAEPRGSVLVITLNRPEKLNAWSAEMEETYFDLLEAAERSPAVRAIVVTGAGRGFCAGADLEELEQVDQSDLSVLDRGRPTSYPITVRKPLVAALNGPAAGIGLVQALYCDVRIATPAAKLTTAFARRGLIAEHGSAWLLPRMVGRGAALDLLLSGRVFLAEEAYSLGLVDSLAARDEVLDVALSYATDLAENCSPTSIDVIKRQVERGMDQSLEEALADADAEMRESFKRVDVKEGVASYRQGRPPAFQPLPAGSVGG